MKKPYRVVAAAACVLLGLDAPVLAKTCYEIIDSGNNLVYQSTIPPIEMAGEGWAAAQAKLRGDGDHLRWYESNDCIGRTTGRASAKDAAKGPVGFDPDIILKGTADFQSPAAGSRYGSSSAGGR
jgi:hypothetical protein